MNKFWAVESDVVKIDEERLYDYLSEKGYRYFKTTDNHKYIMSLNDRDVQVFFENRLWRFCSSLIDSDNDFTSLTEEDRTRIKLALKDCRETLKKSKLAQFRYEDLEQCDDTPSKVFIQKFITKSSLEKGGTL